MEGVKRLQPVRDLLQSEEFGRIAGGDVTRLRFDLRSAAGSLTLFESILRSGRVNEGLQAITANALRDMVEVLGRTLVSGSMSDTLNDALLKAYRDTRRELTKVSAATGRRVFLGCIHGFVEVAFYLF